MQDPSTNHCLRFAQGVARGEWNGENDRLFVDMVQVMVTKKSKELRGVGLQNFRYPAYFDEFAHHIAILSPTAYRVFSDKFQGRDLREFR